MNQSRCWPKESIGSSPGWRRGIAGGADARAACRRCCCISSSSRRCRPERLSVTVATLSATCQLLAFHLPLEAQDLRLELRFREALNAVEQLPGLARLLLAPELCDRGGQLGHRRALEEEPDRQLDFDGIAHAGHQPGREQRVAAEVEEVVVDADLGDSQQLFPDAADEGLQLVARGGVLDPQAGSGVEADPTAS